MDTEGRQISRQLYSKALRTRLPAELHAALQTAAVQSGVCVSAYVRFSIAEQLARRGVRLGQQGQVHA